MLKEKMGRRERKKLLSRKAILDAAARAFSEKGFRETSVADIMNAADLGIGTFYNYFESKEEILMCLLGQLVQEARVEIDALRTKGSTASELLTTVCSMTARFLDENRFVLPLFLSGSEHSAMPEGIAPSRQLETPGFKSIFGQILRQGQETGEFRCDVPVDLLAEMFHSLYQAAAFSKLTFSFRENVALKTRILLDGIRAK